MVRYKFKNNKRFISKIVLSLFLISLFSFYNKLVSQNYTSNFHFTLNIKTKEDAKNEIKKLKDKVSKLEENYLYKEAIYYLKKILSLERNFFGEDYSALAETILWIGENYYKLGLYNKAEESYISALEIEEKALGQNHPDLAVSLVSIGNLYQAKGAYKKAEENYIRALEIEEKALGENHPEIANTLIYLGGFYQQQGFYEKAQQKFSRALKIREKAFGKDHPITAVSIGTLGDLYQKQGFYQKSEENFTKALEIQEKTLGKDHPEVAKTLISLGNLYQEKGVYKKAEENYIRALEIEEKALGENHPEIAITLISLGDLYEQQGFYEKAENKFLRALEIEEKTLGKDHPAVANTLAWLGFLHSNQGQYEKGENYLLSALNIFKKALGKNHPHIAITYFDLAMFIYAKKEDYKNAEKFLQDALKINKEYLGESNSIMALNYKYLGEIYTLQSKYKLAANSNRNSIAILLELMKRELPFVPISTRRHFSRIIDDALPKTIYGYNLKSYSRKKLALLLRINRQGLSEEIEKIQSKLSLLEGPQKQLASKLKDVINNLSSTKISKEERLRIKIKREKLEKELYSILPEIKIPFIEIKQISNILKPGEALLEFQRYKPYKGIQDGEKRFGDSHFFGRKQIQNNNANESRYLAIILKPNGIIHTIDLGIAEKIDERINLALISSEEGLEDAQKLWKDVGELVIEPLKKVLNNENTLFISPDAELNRVPFSALSSFEENMLLGEAVNIRLLTTGRELIKLSKKSKNVNQFALVIADPSFNIIENIAYKNNDKFQPIKISQQRSGDLLSLRWPLLPGTAIEGKTISEILDSQLLTKNKATVSAIQKLEMPKIIHIASHAYFLPNQKNNENPLLRSGIVLAGANEPELNPLDDGYLTALEVTKLNWQGTELVVISGCESGKGDIRSGEGIYGLKRAIAVAGARSSVLSLWKVDDIATADFMEKFYQKLKDGMGRSEALAETQKEFKNHSILRFRHPYYWAAFQLSGDWRPIDF